MSTAAANPSPRASLRRYVTAVAVAGSALFAFCVARLIGQDLPVECLVFAGLTFISGRITLKVPSLDASFTVSEVFTFTCVLLSEPAGGTICSFNTTKPMPGSVMLVLGGTLVGRGRPRSWCAGGGGGVDLA